MSYKLWISSSLSGIQFQLDRNWNSKVITGQWVWYILLIEHWHMLQGWLTWQKDHSIWVAHHCLSQKPCPAHLEPPADPRSKHRQNIHDDGKLWKTLDREQGHAPQFLQKSSPLRQATGGGRSRQTLPLITKVNLSNRWPSAADKHPRAVAAHLSLLLLLFKQSLNMEEN